MGKPSSYWHMLLPWGNVCCSQPKHGSTCALQAHSEAQLLSSESIFSSILPKMSPFPLSQHVRAYIFLLQKLCLSLACILSGKAIKHSWTSLSQCMCKVWGRSSRHLSVVALRMQRCLGAAWGLPCRRHLAAQPPQPLTVNDPDGVTQGVTE